MKNNKTPSYIKVGIFTIITTVAWIFFGVYRTLTAKPSPNLPEKILEPFSPELNTQNLDAIEAKLFFEEGEVPAFTPTTPAPTASAESTPISLPTQTPEATTTPTETEQPATDSGEIAP